MTKVFSKADQELFNLSWPIFIELFLKVAIGNLNVWMIARYSETAVAAIGSANQLLNLTVFVYGFVSVGTQILIAQTLGAKREEKVPTIINTALFASLGIGILIAGVFCLFSTQLLTIMNLGSELVRVGTRYLQIFGASMLFSSITGTILAVMRSHSYTRPALLVPLLSSMIAVIGNYFALYAPFGLPHLGVNGLAISSAVANVLSLVLALFLLKQKIGFSITKLKVKGIHFKMFQQILRFGLPSSGESFSYQGAQVVVVMFVATLGTDVLIAKSYALTISQFVYMATSALGQGNQILIGRYVGAKEYDKAKQRGFRTLKIGIMLSVTIGLITFLAIQPLAGLFTQNVAIMHLLRAIFLVEIFLETVRAINLILVNALNASGDMKFPLFCSIIVLWLISLPFSYSLAIIVHLGLVGVWIAYTIDEGVRGMLMIRRWRSEVWQKKLD